MLKLLTLSMIRSLGTMLPIRREKLNGWTNVRKPLIHWRFCAPPPQSWFSGTSISPSSCIVMPVLLVWVLFCTRNRMGKIGWFGYASRALSRSESYYLAHKLEFLALKWAVTESFQEYLYGNTFTSYSDNNPLTYFLTTTKLDAMEHRWIAKLAKFKFKVYYQSENLNMEADALSRIPWDQSIRAEAVEAIFKAAMEGPTNFLMEVYACHEKTISSLTLRVLPSMDDCCWLASGPESGFNCQPGNYLDGKLIGWKQ